MVRTATLTADRPAYRLPPSAYFDPDWYDHERPISEFHQNLLARLR